MHAMVVFWRNIDVRSRASYCIMLVQACWYLCFLSDISICMILSLLAINFTFTFHTYSMTWIANKFTMFSFEKNINIVKSLWF